MEVEVQPLELPKETEGLSSEDGQRSRKCHCNWVKFKEVCLSLFVGQLLAGCLGISNVCLALLARAHINLPVSQMFPQYSSLAVIYGTVRLVYYCQRRAGQPVPSACNPNGSSDENGECTWRRTILLLTAGIVDMHSFWATLSAFGYTNVTSIQLLDCLSIPTSMFLSFLVLRHRYLWTHYLGSVICIGGASMMVVADMMEAEDYPVNNITKVTDLSPKEVVLGDVLAISGAVLYGVSSVIQEYIVESYGSSTYLFGGPTVAAIISGIYCACLEREELHELFTKSTIHGYSVPTVAIAYFCGYLLFMFCLDSLMAYTIANVSAVLINLSFLSADVYALMAGIWLFHVPFHFLYFLAFALIITGVILFAIRNAYSRDPVDT